MTKLILAALILLLFYASLPPHVQDPINRMAIAAFANIKRTAGEIGIAANVPRCIELERSHSWEQVRGMAERGECRELGY